MENTDQARQKTVKLGSHLISAIGFASAGFALGAGYSQGFSVIHGIGAAFASVLGAEFTRKTL